MSESVVSLYHGTKAERAASMLAYGVDLEHPKKSDPGDFGLGFYLTSDKRKARRYGPAVLEVEVDVREFAYIPNAYYPQEWSEAGRLFASLAFGEKETMWTCDSRVSREDKMRVAKSIREAFLSRGWKGIITDNNLREVVVFDLGTIKSMRLDADGPDIRSNPGSPWSKKEADAFLSGLYPALEAAGFRAEIVGSVKKKGKSGKDLDILLQPTKRTTVSDGIAALEEHVAPLSDQDAPPDVIETIHGWAFAMSFSGKTVEFFFPPDMPVEDNPPHGKARHKCAGADAGDLIVRALEFLDKHAFYSEADEHSYFDLREYGIGQQYSTGTCTFSAAILARLLTSLGAKVKGYLHDYNLTAKLGEAEGGHDFVVLMDGTVIDWWAKDTYGESPVEPPGPAQRKKYGPPSKWEIGPLGTEDPWDWVKKIPPLE